MVEGGMKCIKYLIFSFNLIFVVTGLALIIVGALVKTEFQEYDVITDSSYTSSAAFLIAVGVIIFIIAFFGSFGAWKENFCMVTTFAFLLGLIFIFELAAGIAGYVLRDDIEKELKSEMYKSLNNYNSSEPKQGIIESWNRMQNELGCCGVVNSSDWQTTPPESCCKEEVANCSVEGKPLFTEGCLTKLENFLTDNALKIGAAGIALAFIQILGVTLACCLARAIKKEYAVV